MKKVPRIEKKIKKERVLFLFKGSPGVYGKNRKQSKAEDFIKIKRDTNIPSISIITRSKLYVRDKNKNYLNKNLLNIILILCITSIMLLKFVVYDYFQSEKLKSLEILISNLCFAFIASYIFYIVVIQRTEKNKKIETYAVVCGLIDSMIVHGKTIKKWLLLSAGEEITQSKFSSNDIEQIKKLCEKANIFKKLEETEKTTAELFY